jgi:hypothetical protein
MNLQKKIFAGETPPMKNLQIPIEKGNKKEEPSLRPSILPCLANKLGI